MADYLPLPVQSKTQQLPSVFSVVSFYWITSLSVVFLNKTILSSKQFTFPYPLFVTWFQLLVALLLLVFGHRFKK